MVMPIVAQLTKHRKTLLNIEILLKHCEPLVKHHETHVKHHETHVKHHETLEHPPLDAISALDAATLPSMEFISNVHL